MPPCTDQDLIRAGSRGARQPPRLRGAPLLGSALPFLRDPVALLSEGYRRLGPIFSLRLGSREVVALIGPAYHRAFFAQTDRLLSIREAYPFFHRMFHEELYFMAEREEYRFQRALIAPLFHGPLLATHLGAMRAEAARFVAGLGEEGVLDLPRALGPLVMHVAARALLGEEIRDRLAEELFTVFREFSAGIDPLLPPWLPLPHLRRSARARRRLHDLVRGLLADRRRAPRPDFLQRLVDARREDGAPLRDEILINLVLMLVWAGHETTVGHLSWALLDLLQAPGYLRSVEEELQAVVGDGELDLAGARRLSRLHLALRETGRLHPHAYVLLRAAREDLSIDGFAVPRGALVLVSPAVAHRLPDLFPEPHRYEPERFLRIHAPDLRHALIGFGGGEHRCAGARFAELEMQVVLAALLRGFELRLLDGEPRPVPGPRGKWPAGPCRVHYRRRH